MLVSKDMENENSKDMADSTQAVDLYHDKQLD
jgi:hypothetical protein